MNISNRIIPLILVSTLIIPCNSSEKDRVFRSPEIYEFIKDFKVEYQKERIHKVNFLAVRFYEDSLKKKYLILQSDRTNRQVEFDYTETVDSCVVFVLPAKKYFEDKFLNTKKKKRTIIALETPPAELYHSHLMVYELNGEDKFNRAKRFPEEIFRFNYRHIHFIPPLRKNRQP